MSYLGLDKYQSTLAL